MKNKIIDLYQLFKDNKPKLNDNSINDYINKLKYLNDKNDIIDFNYLIDTEKIFNKIKDFKPSTFRNYISSICSLLNFYKINNKKFEKIYLIYFNKLKEFNNELKDNTLLNDKENENWLTQDEINNKYNELYEIYDKIDFNKNITSKDLFNKILDLVILSLYTDIPARRNKDYLLMKFVKKYDKSLSDDFNYFSIKDKKFYFNNYKTSNTYNQQSIDVPDKLYNLLLNFIKINNNEDNYLLITYNNKELKNGNTIINILSKIFKKKIGCSMLRKIYLTNKYGKLQDELKEDAKEMGTSTNVVQSQYIKQKKLKNNI